MAGNTVRKYFLGQKEREFDSATVYTVHNTAMDIGGDFTVGL